MLRSIFLALMLIGGPVLLTSEPLHGQFRADPWTVVQPGMGVRLADGGATPQILSPRLHPAAEQFSGARQTRSATAALLGSAGGWLGGVVLGYAIGAVIDGDTANEYWPISDGATMGAVAGMVVGPPIGAHLANRRQGNPLLSTLAGVGATAGMLFVASTGVADPGVALALMPLAQIVATGVVEHRTGR